MTQIRERRIRDNIASSLRLNARYDKVPSDLAETKILPVFEVYPKGRYKIVQDLEEDVDDKTFTVPESQQWTIKGIQVLATSPGIGTARRWAVKFIDAQGNDIGIVVYTQACFGQTDMIHWWLPQGAYRDVANITTTQVIPEITLGAGSSIQVYDYAGNSGSADDIKVTIHYLEQPDNTTE